MTPELKEELDRNFRDSFMKPQAFKGIEIQEELMESGLDVEDDSFYCRLSANGFLDCTDWYGPFDSLEDCAEYLIDVHGLE